MPEVLTSTRLTVTPLAGHIGAEIGGADTGAPLADDVIAQIRQALLDHKVVFLRGQSLDYRRQVSFAERLGPLTLGHPTLASPPGQPLLEEIDSLKGGKANYWHTDVTFVDRPPAFTLLHAVVIPPVGGDTLWANTVSAYQSLPPELRDLADRLRVLHTNDFDYARTFNRGERVDPALAAAHEEFISTVYETEHPLVRVHPETSERSLVLGGFARTVLGFTPQASRDLIRLLQDYITRPEHTVVIGVALGAGMSASRVVRHAIDPVIEVLRPLPPLAFIPLFIIWLGIGEMPKEVLILIGVAPIMAVVTVAALDEVPEDLRLCARTLGASPRYTMLRVQIRAALPGILTGMRIAMAGAWTSIVAAELIAATSGLGYLIMQAGDYLNTALVFSGIIMIAIIALVLDACLRGLLLLADPSRRR